MNVTDDIPTTLEKGQRRTDVGMNVTDDMESARGGVGRAEMMNSP